MAKDAKLKIIIEGVDKSKKFFKGIGTSLKDTAILAGKFALGFGTALAGVGLAAGKLVLDYAKLSDEIFENSEKLGISTTKYQEFQYIAGQIGTDVETIAKSFSKVTNAIGEADKEGSAMSQTFKTLGVNVRDSNGNLRDSEDVFTDLIISLGNMTNETERDILAQDLFGKSFQELTPLIGLTADEMAKLTLEAHESGAVMSEESIKGLADFNDQIQGIKDGLLGTLGTFAAELLPVFAPALDKLKTWLLEKFPAILHRWRVLIFRYLRIIYLRVWVKNKVAIQQIYQDLLDILGMIWDDIVSLFSKKGEDAAAGAKTTQQTIDDFSKSLHEFSTWLHENKELVVSFIEVLGGLLIFSKILTVIESVTTVLNNQKVAFTLLKIFFKSLLFIVNLFFTPISLLLAHFGGIVGILSKLGYAFGVVGAAIASITFPVWGVIAVIASLIAILIVLWLKWDVILPWLKETWSTFTAWLKETWDTFVSWFIIKFDTFDAWLRESWDTVITWLETRWEEFKQNLQTIWDTIQLIFWIAYFKVLVVIEELKKLFTKEYWEEVLNNFKTEFTDWWNNVRDTFKGIKDDITGWIDDVMSWIDKLVKKIGKIKLPDWMTPGSPTPLELGLKGIAKELAFVTKGFDNLGSSTLGLATASTGNITNYNYYLAANYKYQEERTLMNEVKMISALSRYT